MSLQLLFSPPYEFSENSEQIFLIWYADKDKKKNKQICCWKFLSSKIFF